MKINQGKKLKASEVTVKSPVDKSSVVTNVRKVSVMVSLAIAVVVCAGVAVFTAIAIMAHNEGLRASREEYEALRERRQVIGNAEFISTGHNERQWSAFDLEMRAVNPEYAFWIRIDGTNINYPVVRGEDNEKYLNTSFSGESNKVGALFLDYRTDLDSPHLLIYGHNLIEGGMFTDLRRFLNDEFAEDNPYVTIMIYGEEVIFEIFAARLTDVDDPAYNLNLGTPRLFSRYANRIGAPLRASQILTLSTCTRGGSDNERMIVQAYRVR